MSKIKLTDNNVLFDGEILPKIHKPSPFDDRVSITKTTHMAYYRKVPAHMYDGKFYAHKIVCDVRDCLFCLVQGY